MDDGLLWLILISVMTVIIGVAVANCRYEACLEAGFTEKQCKYDSIWNN